MNEKAPLSDEQVEAMVKARLEERAREIDPQPLLARLQERLASPQESEEPSGLASAGPPAHDLAVAARRISQPRPAHWRRRWGVAVAAAAALALSAVGVIYVWPSSASAATLVLATKRVHELPVDRCYLVEVQPSAPDESTLAPKYGRVDRLWTRGDRFFIESSNRQDRWTWGQDNTGAGVADQRPETGPATGSGRGAARLPEAVRHVEHAVRDALGSTAGRFRADLGSRRRLHAAADQSRPRRPQGGSAARPRPGSPLGDRRRDQGDPQTGRETLVSRPGDRLAARNGDVHLGRLGGPAGPLLPAGRTPRSPVRHLQPGARTGETKRDSGPFVRSLDTTRYLRFTVSTVRAIIVALGISR